MYFSQKAVAVLSAFSGPIRIPRNTVNITGGVTQTHNTNNILMFAQFTVWLCLRLMPIFLFTLMALKQPFKDYTNSITV